MTKAELSVCFWRVVLGIGKVEAIKENDIIIFRRQISRSLIRTLYKPTSMPDKAMGEQGSCLKHIISANFLENKINPCSGFAECTFFLEKNQFSFF